MRFLGVLGFWEPFLSEVFLHAGEIDFLEIIADHYFDPTRRKAEELELLAAHFPLVPHGLDLSLGSAEGLDEEYVRRMAALVNQLNPPWWSEHIAFTRAGGVEIGHLSPVPFTWEALEVLARNIRTVQARIAAPLILENITYTLRWHTGSRTAALENGVRAGVIAPRSRRIIVAAWVLPPPERGLGSGDCLRCHWCSATAAAPGAERTSPSRSSE